jgi:hypothetical protein
MVEMKNVESLKLCTYWGKELVTVVPVHSVKSVEVSGDIAALIFNSDIGLRWTDSYLPWPPYLRETTTGVVILMT